MRCPNCLTTMIDMGETLICPSCNTFAEPPPPSALSRVRKWLSDIDGGALVSGAVGLLIVGLFAGWVAHSVFAPRVPTRPVVDIVKSDAPVLSGGSLTDDALSLSSYEWPLGSRIESVITAGDDQSVIFRPGRANMPEGKGAAHVISALDSRGELRMQMPVPVIKELEVSGLAGKIGEQLIASSPNSHGMELSAWDPDGRRAWRRAITFPSQIAGVPQWIDTAIGFLVVAPSENPGQLGATLVGDDGFADWYVRLPLTSVSWSAVGLSPFDELVVATQDVSAEGDRRLSLILVDMNGQIMMSSQVPLADGESVAGFDLDEAGTGMALIAGAPSRLVALNSVGAVKAEVSLPSLIIKDPSRCAVRARDTATAIVCVADGRIDAIAIGAAGNVSALLGARIGPDKGNYLLTSSHNLLVLRGEDKDPAARRVIAIPWHGIFQTLRLNYNDVASTGFSMPLPESDRDPSRPFDASIDAPSLETPSGPPPELNETASHQVAELEPERPEQTPIIAASVQVRNAVADEEEALEIAPQEPHVMTATCRISCAPEGVPMAKFPVEIRRRLGDGRSIDDIVEELQQGAEALCAEQNSVPAPTPPVCETP